VLQLRDDDLLDVGLEGLAVGRAAQDEGRDHPTRGSGRPRRACPRARPGGGRLPVPVGDAPAQALAAWARPCVRAMFVLVPSIAAGA
jgi:hypothetical protein